MRRIAGWIHRNRKSDLHANDTAMAPESDSRARFLVLSSSPESVDVFLQYLRSIYGATSILRKDSDFVISLTMPSSPVFTLERELDPGIATVGLLIVDADGYDRFDPDASIKRTLFQDDIDLFHRLTSSGGPWHDKPFCVVLLNLDTAFTRIQDGQLLKLYPPELHGLGNYDPLDLYTPDDRVRGFGLFLLGLLHRNTDKDTTYDTWLEKEKDPAELFRWMEAVLQDVKSASS